MRRVAILAAVVFVMAAGPAGAATFEIATTGANTYAPAGLRVAPGDTVRWAASFQHPLRFEDGTPGSFTMTQERTLTMPGALAFFCTAHGGPGGEGMSGVVTVGTPNQPPALQLVRETPSPRAGQPVAFAALASDPERIRVRIDWDLDGDGTYEETDAGGSRSMSYAAGRHTVRVRATDDLGLEAAAEVTFDVTGDPLAPTPPTGGGPPSPSQPVADLTAPGVELAAPRGIGRTALRTRGVRLVVVSTEDGRIEAALRDARRRTLARRAVDVRAGREVVLRLRARRARAGRLTLRVAVSDAAGNRRVTTRRLTVRGA